MDIKNNATLDAVDRIITTSSPSPSLAPLKGDGPSQIQFLEAFKDVHMTSGSKVLLRPRPARRQVRAGADPGRRAPAFVAGPVVRQAAPPPPPRRSPRRAPRKFEPAVDGRANYVYATILQDEAAKKSEIKDAKLRGGRDGPSRPQARRSPGQWTPPARPSTCSVRAKA